MLGTTQGGFCFGQPFNVNVPVDVPGEYDRNKMLSSDKVADTGIWGPVPAFNECNYTPVLRLPDCGLRGFVESENLLFRPARALPLDRPTASPAAAESGSTRSNRTSGASATCGATRP